MPTTRTPSASADADKRDPISADCASPGWRTPQPGGLIAARATSGGSHAASDPSAGEDGTVGQPSCHRLHARQGRRLSPARRHWHRAPRAGGDLLSLPDELHAEDAVARRLIAPMLAPFAKGLFTRVEVRVRQTVGGAR